MPLDGATLGFMPKPDNSAFALAIANRIRLAREEAGYHSAAEFFRELGKEGWESHFRSQNTWHQYERGELLMSVPKLIRVAEVASVSLDWLLAGEESVPPPTWSGWSHRWQRPLRSKSWTRYGGCRSTGTPRRPVSTTWPCRRFVTD